MRICSECGRQYSCRRSICSTCATRQRRAKIKPVPCVNCRQVKKPTSRGLCNACYRYENLYGIPRPASQYNRVAIGAEYFAEDWHHMRNRVGLPYNAAVHRLCEGLGLSEQSVLNYIREYSDEKQAA